MYYLTGEEYQIKNAYPDYFPVNEKAQQRIWDIVSATKETTLSDGTQVNPYRCEVAYNDYEVVVEALDQEQLHSIKAWLDMPCVLYPQKKKYVELIEEEVIKYLEEHGLEYKNYGTYSTDSCDYPDYAKKVAEAILAGECEKGILICGTGIGITIAANRYEGIRAANCTNSFMAEATREHNDANILGMGARVIGVGTALKIVDTFLNTPFSNDERHKRRIAKIEH